MEKGSPGSLSLYIHLQEQMALKLWLCARTFQEAYETWSWKAEEKEKMEAKMCPSSPRFMAGHCSSPCPATTSGTPSSEPPSPAVKSIALHTAASAASNPVGSNGKLEKDRPHSIRNYININEASVQGEMLGQELAAKA